jgi:drug/metabolite transporter (DMT)-like permease
LNGLNPDAVPLVLRMHSVGLHGHLLLAFKSCLVGISWTLAFFAIKHLPISIATPIRSTSPFWTVIIAIGLFQERPSTGQACGVLLILAAFVAFAFVGKREGVLFHSDRWVGLMVLATLLGSLSAIYDKYLLQIAKINPATVQAWFSVYLVPVMMPLWIWWWKKDRVKQPFTWRISIPMIAVCLLIADFSYFTALSNADALISVVSPLRRTSVLIPFLFGVLWMGEKSWLAKLACIIAILLGVYVISR